MRLPRPIVNMLRVLAQVAPLAQGLDVADEVAPLSAQWQNVVWHKLDCGLRLAATKAREVVAGLQRAPLGCAEASYGVALASAARPVVIPLAVWVVPNPAQRGGSVFVPVLSTPYRNANSAGCYVLFPVAFAPLLSGSVTDVGMRSLIDGGTGNYLLPVRLVVMLARLRAALSTLWVEAAFLVSGCAEIARKFSLPTLRASLENRQRELHGGWYNLHVITSHTGDGRTGDVSASPGLLVPNYTTKQALAGGK